MIPTCKIIITAVLQFTWGALQTTAGAVLTLILIKRRHFIYRGSVACEWGRGESLSLGMFIFISEQAQDRLREELCAHEYGHSVQSMLLGPLYLPVIVLPSALWCMFPACKRHRSRTGLSYYGFFTERWANMIAEGLTGERFTILI